MASGAVLVALGALLAPVDVPHTVETIGRVQPAREWALVRTPNGALSATLSDHRTGSVTTTFTAEPARGDAGRFELGPVAAQRSVEAGQTIGSFSSSDLAVRLVEIEGQIGEAEAQLRLQGTGQKASRVETAQRELDRAKEARERASEVADRQRRLVEAGLAADQDLEAAEAAVRLADADIAVAQARLRVAETGDRPEAEAVTRARVSSLQQTARALANRRRSSALVVPISGHIQREFSPDTLLLVADTTSYLIALPVAWRDQSLVKAGQSVSVSGVGAETMAARLLDVRSAAASGTGQAYLVGLAALVPGESRPIPGLVVRCSIQVGTRRPIDIVRAWLREVVAA